MEASNETETEFEGKNEHFDTEISCLKLISKLRRCNKDVDNGDVL